MNTDTMAGRRRAPIIWAGITLALLTLFVIVRLSAGGGVGAESDGAQERAIGYAAVIGEGVIARPGEEASFDRRELYTTLQGDVFSDPTVARVRVYGNDGVLLFATDQDVRPGDVRAPSDDPGVNAASAGGLYQAVITADFTWSTVGSPPRETELLQTFQPLVAADRIEPAGVVEVDFFMDPLRGAAIASKDTLLSVVAILALLALSVTILTYRRVIRAPHPSGEGGSTIEVVEVAEGAAAAAEAPEELPGERDPKTVARAAAAAAEVVSLRKQLKAAESRRAEAERERQAAELELQTVAREKHDVEAELQRLRLEESASPLDDDEVIERLEEQLAQAEPPVADADQPAPDADQPAPDAERSVPEPEVDAADVERGDDATQAPETPNAEPVRNAAPHAEMTDEASDLRTRLAKTAARKRLGQPPSDDGS